MSGKVGPFNDLLDADIGWCLKEERLDELRISHLRNICRTMTSLFTHFSDEARRRQSEARRQQIIDAELEPEIAVTPKPEKLRGNRLTCLDLEDSTNSVCHVAPNLLLFTASGDHSFYTLKRPAHINLPVLTELTLSLHWPWSATCLSLSRLNLLEHTDMRLCPLRSSPSISAPMMIHVCLHASWWGASEKVMGGRRSLGLRLSQSDHNERGPITHHLPRSVRDVILRLEPTVGRMTT